MIALLAAAAYAGVVLQLLLGMPVPFARGLLPLPLAVGLALLLWRHPLTPAQRVALAGTTVIGAAYYAAIIVFPNPLYALVVPAAVVMAMLCARQPVVAVGTLLFCTGAFGSLQAFFDFSAPQLSDLVLVGLWLSAGWTWLTAPRRDLPITPALAVLAAYLVISLIEVLVADSRVAAVQSFRGQNWYLAVVILLAVAPWTASTRTRMVHVATAVGLAIGAYATLRWVIGPAGVEEAAAAQYPNNFLDDELRPVGSFATAKELAAWTAIVAPFLMGVALTNRGSLRLIAFLATALCVIGMLAADVRAGTAAAVPAVIVVVALYQVAQAFRGRRGPLVAVTIMIALAGSVVAFAITLGDKPDTRERYTNILDPQRDASYQARLVKWRTALDDIEREPLGHGLGSAGRAQQRYGATTNVSSDSIDSSYLKVAYEQGFVIMIVLAGGLVLLLLTLVKGAAIETDPAAAGPALAAAGALVSMLLLFWVGSYIEGLPALGGWLLVGIGIGCARAHARPPLPSST